MHNDPYIIALVYKKLVHTQLMIQSLVASGIQRLDFMFAETPELTQAMLEEMAQPLHSYRIFACLGNRTSQCHAYRSAFIHMLAHEIEHETEWYVLVEDDIIFNPGWLDKCIEAYHLAQNDDYKVGVVSPLHWEFGWYGIKAHAENYTVKDWFTTHCLVLHRDVLLHGVDLSRPFWHQVDIGLDKLTGLMFTEKGFVNISTNPSQAFSLDGGEYAVQSFMPANEEVHLLCKRLVQIQGKELEYV